VPTVLITGANRGLGLEFCRHYSDKDWTVIACCRNPKNANELNTFRQSNGNIQIEALALEHLDQIDTLSKKLSDIRIDVLINNAGVYDDNRNNAFGHLDFKAWNNSFLINTQAPMKMAEAFLPQIQRSAKKLIVNISSLMGSISDNGSGGSLFYRSSKAALNAAMKTLSIDLKNQGIGVLILHPGWVQTDMGGQNAPIDCKTSVGGMAKTIEKFTLEQSGHFISFDGKPMPW